MLYGKYFVIKRKLSTWDAMAHHDDGKAFCMVNNKTSRTIHLCGGTSTAMKEKYRSKSIWTAANVGQVFY